MKIIVGLGNPGKEYINTRHNVGFMFLDALASCKAIVPDTSTLKFLNEKKFEALVAETNAHGQKLILVKPQTFMNASGKTVTKIINFYKAESKDLIVISDDLDLPLGMIRVRKEGTSGGHKGLQNIIDSIGTDKFTRIRLGISIAGEKVGKIETSDYVLGQVGKRQEKVLEKTISEAVNLLAEYITEKKEMPSHSIEVVAKEQSVEK